jgi:hypothetical protein
MRRYGLPLAALGCIGCMAGAAYLMIAPIAELRATQPPPGSTPNPQPAPWYFYGLSDVLTFHLQGWPVGARALLGGASLLALLTAVLRVERATWRRGLSAALAWGGVGVMIAAWTAVMPMHAPPWEWSTIGLSVGLIGGLAFQWLLGYVGRRQALRDCALSAFTGYMLAWALWAIVRQ